MLLCPQGSESECVLQGENLGSYPSEEADSPPGPSREYKQVEHLLQLQGN